MFEKILKNKSLMIFVSPFLLGCLTVFSFQPFNYTFVNFAILPALFLITSYVGKKTKSKYRKKPFYSNLFLVGLSFGFGFFLSGNFWISYSLTFDESFKYLIPFSLILIPLFLGIYFGLGTLIAGTFIQNNFTSILFFSSSLAFIDFLRSKMLTGFPWNLWAYSWSWFPESLQILNPIGIFAFNLITLTIFLSPLLLIFKKKFYNKFIFFFLFSIFFTNFLYGSYVINNDNKKYDKLELNEQNSINVKIVSPNFELEYNPSKQRIQESLAKLIRYSDPDQKETIFIWPEGIFAGYEFSEILEYKTIIKERFTKKHIIIFGINTFDKEKNGFYNSLIAINNEFEILYKYNKIKLVPFGEFLPLEKHLEKYGFKKITSGFGSFLKGRSNFNFVTDKFNILPLICYEIIFTELTQKAFDDTSLIVNISEDAWFGGSIGPYQHFSKAIFRAIESNVFIARSANKGISGFINNRGIIIKSLKPSEAGNIELKILTRSANSKNRNDLIFFVLLFTNTIIFFTLKNKL